MFICWNRCTKCFLCGYIGIVETWGSADSYQLPSSASCETYADILGNHLRPPDMICRPLIGLFSDISTSSLSLSSLSSSSSESELAPSIPDLNAKGNHCILATATSRFNKCWDHGWAIRSLRACFWNIILQPSVANFKEATWSNCIGTWKMGGLHMASYPWCGGLLDLYPSCPSHKKLVSKDGLSLRLQLHSTSPNTEELTHNGNLREQGSGKQSFRWRKIAPSPEQPRLAEPAAKSNLKAQWFWFDWMPLLAAAWRKNEQQLFLTLSPSPVTTCRSHIHPTCGVRPRKMEWSGNERKRPNSGVPNCNL